eukprot:TRINITY_DN10478_c0_g1_i3.p1 TRINITY_DN10478_c0_g1~~TRINITY_DN10478_c0_g1_i3.p1  ORF type:complete len:175 (+),score=20.04 TRINITY_DN10478_c0_g1_i3:164-688(+)
MCIRDRFYPSQIKIRALVCATIYSFVESAFTVVERHGQYTSTAQFWGNLLYIPVLLDLYGSVFEEWPVLYVGFFPFNVWILEVVLHALFLLLYGRNVAWCYRDYSDEYLNGCVRVGHGAAWLVMGMACLYGYPMLREEVARNSEMSLWDFCGAIHNTLVAWGISSGERKAFILR